MSVNKKSNIFFNFTGGSFSHRYSGLVYDIPCKHFRKLAESMTRHVAVVIKARGATTCY